MSEISLVVQEDDTTTFANLRVNFASGHQDDSEQADLEPFSAADLEAFAKAESGPLFAVVKKLINIAQERPEYKTDNAMYGRFALCSYAQSAFNHRLAFRLARQALDFLEADYLACERDDVEFWRRQVNEIDAMCSGSTLEDQMRNEAA